jgi:hypothetical protein
MRQVNNFKEFLSENWGKAFLSQWGELQDAIIKVKADPDLGKPEKVESPSGGGTPAVSALSASDANSLSAVLNKIQGSNDFLLYLQHQQGLAGAKSLIEASAGTGKIHPSTLKVKNCSALGGKVPYANLQCNIPGDQKKTRDLIVNSLKKGDEKTAATAFLQMWKEKWNTTQKKAKALVAKPEGEAIKKIIEKYCKQYKVPFDFAITVAMIESGLNPKSGNSVYKGLFALSEKEFQKYVKGGNILKAEDNANAGIQCLKNNAKDFIKTIQPLVAKANIGTWPLA